MKTNPNLEERALKAYLKLLGNKGADSANLERRREFLQRLVAHLHGRQPDSVVYREVVDETLGEIDRESWPFFLAVAREYYHFWTNDLKAITAFHASGGFEVEPIVFEAHGDESLKLLWKNIGNEQFNVGETWPLKAYMAALREEGADQVVVETRIKLVKLLLVRLREVHEKNGKNYRVVVDSLLSLFVMKEMRYLFLIVVREFFYFWMGDPDAASHIFMDAPAAV